MTSILTCKYTKTFKYKVSVNSVLKPKSILYGAYLALKLWFYRKIKGKKKNREEPISI